MPGGQEGETPGRGDSLLKDPEVGMHLGHRRNSGWHGWREVSRRGRRGFVTVQVAEAQ